MTPKIKIATLILILSTSAYAIGPDTVQEGAEQYDWQTCVNTASAGCINNCATSEDRDCNDNCKDLAKDKCQSQGINPPS